MSLGKGGMNEYKGKGKIRILVIRERLEGYTNLTTLERRILKEKNGTGGGRNVKVN